MSSDQSEKERETNISTHVFSVSSGMVGVCLTVIGLIRVVVTLRKISTIADDLLAIDALLFLIASLLSYAALRTPGTRRMQMFERIADRVFICAMILMTIVCLHPIVEAQGGILLGASDGKKWMKAESAAKSLPAKQDFRLFDLAGEFAKAEGGKAAPDDQVCPETFIVPLTPVPERAAIGLAASWNPLPRQPKMADLTQRVYLDATRAFLESRGLKNPEVKIKQIIRVDLDGDGEEEVLISATNYLTDGDGITSSAKAGAYSCVFLRRVVKGQVRTQFVAGEFYPKAKTFNAPNEYSVAAVLDLNGEGEMEVVVRSAYYEGGSTSVYRCTETKVTELLTAGCGV